MDTLGVWAGPGGVGGLGVAGESLVWAASEGLVITPISRPHTHDDLQDSTPNEAESEGLTGIGRSGEHRQCYTQYTQMSSFTKLDTIVMSPDGQQLVVGGRTAGGEGLMVWREWPLVTSNPAQVILRGHTVHHMEFNGAGSHLGVLSTTSSNQSLKTSGNESRDSETKLTLSVWQWPKTDLSNSKGGPEAEPARPRQVVAASLHQMKVHQVTRLSLGRGQPWEEVAIMLAVEEEMQVWKLQDGPLGPRLVSTTIGFGLLPPDKIFTMWCLTQDAYALGVGSGWVMVSVSGEVMARLGGGAAGPCHNGPLTDLHFHSSHLYTVGGDGWLRVWEAEMVEEAALKTTRGVREIEGWFEPGIKTSWLQLVRELHVHGGPGSPITLTPTSVSTPVWIVQTTTGVIYAVWTGEWTAHVLHQGPSGRVTGVALSPATVHHRPLLATTTHHRYLQVATLPQPDTEENLGTANSTVRVLTTLARAQVEGVPSCVTWAPCQVTHEYDLVVIGLEDGSVNVFLLHVAPKIFETRLTLIQVERPHESTIHHISTSKETEVRGGEISILVTSAEDYRIFIFRLIRGAKLTKLDPVGYHQLECMPERISVKGEIVVVELLDGLVLKIPAIPTTSPLTLSSPALNTPVTSARVAADSWLLQQHTVPQVAWQGVDVVHQQVLEEAANTCYRGDKNTLLITLSSPDGGSMVGVTPQGRVVHTHKRESTYSVRLSAKMHGSSTDHVESTLENTREATDFKKHKEKPEVVASVGEDGTWACAWMTGGDLFVYRARGASFPLPQDTQRKLRLVSVRGVGTSTAGPSLDQRAQKEAGEKRKAAMENRATLLQQKLSKLKWDFRKLTLRADEVEGGAAMLEDIPLHSSISSTLHKHTTDNMNKVVSGSSRELERLEVLLGKLKTLYSWNPLVSVPAVQFFSSGKVLMAVDNSEEVFALLSRLAQICHGRDVVNDEAAAGDGQQSLVVVKVQSLLAAWLSQLRAGGRGNAVRSGESSLRTGEGEGEGAVADQGDNSGYLTPRPAHPLARKAGSSEGHEGDTSDEAEEQQNLATLEVQVREVVERVGSAGRPGGGDQMSEGELDLGRELRWRRVALTRLRQHRAGEEARACQLTTYKKEHSVPQEENSKGREEGGEGEKAENEKEIGMEEEIVVPPLSATVEEVETHLWALLGKVEEEAQKTKKTVKEAAAAQENLLEKVNLHRKEWGHIAFTLPHLPHHLYTQVTDDLVNEFYCDLLDLEESGEVGSAEESRRRETGDRSSSQRASSSPRRQVGDGVSRASPPSTVKEQHRSRRQEGKRDSERTDVPPLSLTGSPRAGKVKSRTPRTTRTPKTITTRAARTTRATVTPPRTTATPASTTRTPATKTQRSGRGRRSVRDTPVPPPAPRPHLTLEQVQQIQRARTHYLDSFTQVPEHLQQEAQEVEVLLEKCQREVEEEQGRLAWAVLRVGQLVRAMGIMVKYRDTEKKMRIGLRERIKEQQAVKEKVLALRQRITEYEKELECLAGLEEEVDRAFSHLVTDNAQFEVQLTRYYESRTTPGPTHQHPQSASSSSSSSGEAGAEDEGQGAGGGSDSGDSDSGLGTDEARTDGTGGGAGAGGGAGGLRPPGCDPAVFSLVTILRELRCRVGAAAERGRREKAVEERRHAAVMRRLHRATHAAHAALTSLTILQSEREDQLGAIPCVVWLRQSQTAGDITPLTRLPVPNTDVDSMMAVKWYGNHDSRAAAASATDDTTLLTKKYLDQLSQRVTQAKVAQELAARKHREGRAERRALTQQVEQLREELTHLKHSYQVTKECKLGGEAEVDLMEVESKLDASLDLRWPGKVANQMARHDTTMTQLQADMTNRTRELRALQKEEAALAAHILALRQEKDHLQYHLKQTVLQKRCVSRPEKEVGSAEEVQRLRATVTQQDETITALRQEISSLRDKTGAVTLPGLAPHPLTKQTPSSPPGHSSSTWTEEHHSSKATLCDRDSLPHTFCQEEHSSGGNGEDATTGTSGDESSISSSTSSNS